MLSFFGHVSFSIVSQALIFSTILFGPSEESQFSEGYSTLPETNGLPLKMDDWNTIVSFRDGLFSEPFAVSFKEGNTTNRSQSEPKVMMRSKSSPPSKSSMINVKVSCEMSNETMAPSCLGTFSCIDFVEHVLVHYISFSVSWGS